MGAEGEEIAAGATAGTIGADATALIVPSPATRRSRGSRKQGEGEPSYRVEYPSFPSYCELSRQFHHHGERWISSSFETRESRSEIWQLGRFAQPEAFPSGSCFESRRVES